MHTKLTHAPVMPFPAQVRDAHETSRAAAPDAVEAPATRVPAEPSAA
ncbi:hypothetical protein KBZ10_26080 [Streptomyces sp. F63]|nr:hypothetical protein [Streptomyces sp. F63]MBQ0987924.1 hypothetical protein [Streptomyces sp. F63]